MNVTLISIFLMLAATTPIETSELYGTLSVSVTDQSGHPVAEATVYMREQSEPGDSRGSMRAVPACLTDPAGKCSHDRLPLGKYYLSAVKVMDGYPDMSVPLYLAEKPPVTVNLTAPETTVNAAIVLGPKAAILVASVTDSITGKKIDATVILSRPGKPHQSIGTGLDVNSSVLVPPGEPIDLEVRAAGYKTWHPASPLYLASGEVSRISIHLDPQ